MHRFLLNPPIGYEVDHIDGNGLNNRRNNLRIVTRLQNSMNSRPKQRNKSGFKGVYFHKGKYVAYLRIGNNRVYGGRFVDKIDAAKKYNELAIQYHGEFAWLNHISE